jgi:hypothetical protein
MRHRPSAWPTRRDVIFTRVTIPRLERILTTDTAVTIANVNVTNSRGQTLLRITPNAFPATRFSASRDIGDDTPIEYIQVGSAVRESRVLG